MAQRPAWKTTGENVVIRENFSFEWAPGFAASQKKKNVANLHKAISKKTLEVSTKSDDELGRKLSAFNLKLDGIALECVFQASKVYEKGGPYTDLLYVSPKEAKRDSRKESSGKLIGFKYGDVIWPLNPKTTFYDFIYIKAVTEIFSQEELKEIVEYDYFTDIEFNPEKSVNCQARSVAILKQLMLMDVDFSKINDPKEWIAFHSIFVKG